MDCKKNSCEFAVRALQAQEIFDSSWIYTLTGGCYYRFLWETVIKWPVGQFFLLGGKNTRNYTSRKGLIMLEVDHE